MKRKVLAMATIITLAAALVGGGTIAWLTDAAAVENNLFTAGTLDIALDRDASVRVPFDFYDMAPGDTVEASAVAVNAGTLPLQFYAVIEEDERSPEADLAEMLDVLLEVYIGDEVDPYATYTGTLRELLDPDGFLLIEFEADRVFDPGDTATFQFTVYFREESGNEYQGAWWEGTITFYAYQPIPAHTLSVDIGEGEGSVEVNGVGVDVPFTKKYSQGAEVVLKAIPDEDWVFQKWVIDGSEVLDAETTVTMDESKTALACFEEAITYYTLTVDVVGNGSVKVNGDPVTLPYEETYAEGTPVDLEAVADPGREFVKWVINGTEVFDDTTNVTMTQNWTATAYFGREVTEVFTTGQAWVVPDGVTSITVQAWGGGGAGGGSTNAGFLQARGGAGGGGGAYARSVLSVTLGQTLQVVVAAPASGVSGATGNPGGPSLVGPDTNPANALVRAAGGSGGTGNTTGGSPAGGAGGTVSASIGDTRIAGTSGGSGATGLGAASGAGGAGALGGSGGASVSGSGTTSNGNPGTAPGGGGSGGRTSQSGGNRTGGAGARGEVKITYISFE